MSNPSYKLTVSGKFVFELKATHGLPLDFALDMIMNQYQCMVDWVEYIEAARSNKRWDYQTFEDLQHALIDAQIDKDLANGILDRFKIYVVKHPHPLLKNE